MRQFNHYLWLKTLRKFQRIQLKLIQSANKNRKIRLLRKLQILRKRILRFNHKWAIPVCATAIFAFLSNSIYAQDTIQLNNNSRVSQKVLTNKLQFAHADINGDGKNDYVGKASGTRVYVVFGNDSLNIDSVDINNIPSGDGFYITSPSSYEFANKVTTLKDMNGDGFGDIAMFDLVEYYYGVNQFSFVLFGSGQAFPDTVNLDTMSSGDGLRFAANDVYWGDDLTSGDINGDGFSDLVLGNSEEAAVEILYGKPNFTNDTLQWDSLFNGTDGILIREPHNSSFEYLGKDVSIPGDINNDGYDDIIALAGYDTFGRIDTLNWVYGIYGGNQLPPLTIVDSLKGNRGFRIDFEFGFGEVSSAGDLNGDLYDDFFITPFSGIWRPIADSNSYVVYGSCNLFPDSSSISQIAGYRGITIPGFAYNSVEYTTDFTSDNRNDLLLKKGNTLFQINSDSIYYEATNLSDTACQFYDFNGIMLDTTGIYKDTLISTQGCDSIVTLRLQLTKVDTNIIQQGNTLLTNETGTYQWLDCSNNWAKLNGETNSSFSPVSNGNYSVEIIKNNCIDTSHCINVVITNLENVSKLSQIFISPNPTKGSVLISSNKESIKNIRLYDYTGKLVELFSTPPSYLIQLQIEQPKGIYIIEIETIYGNTSIEKLIIH